jgi:lipoprotein-anchoring transpeptidase ErfK/SrfK
MKALVSGSFIFILFLVSVSAQASQGGCWRKECPVYVHVNRAEQILIQYVNLNVVDYDKEIVGYQISSGRDGFTTPGYSGHPVAGRIYDRWDSTIYPGGDYQGLGNMPYAMFFNGGYAIHGTPVGNFAKLGKPASHGCIRMYPEQAKELNRLVRKVGVHNVWFEID